MARTKKFNVGSIVAEIEDWLHRPSNRQVMWDEPRARIAAYLDGQPISAGIVALKLEQLSTWFVAKWAAGAYAGEAAAIDHIHQVAICDALSVVIRRRLYAEDQRLKKKPRLSFNNTSLGLANALVIGRNGEAAAIGEGMSEEIRSGIFYGLETTRVAPFILALYNRRAGLDEPDDQRLAPLPQAYRDLLDLWRTPTAESLAEPLLAACEFHVSRSAEHTNKDTFEFVDEAYRVYPVEILLVLRMREELGLPNAQVEHPLLNTPLGSLPPKRDIPIEPLLRELKLRVDGQPSG